MRTWVGWRGGMLAAMVGGAATAVPLLPTIDLLRYPRGTLIEPDGLFFATIASAAIGVFVVLPMAVVSVIVSHRRRQPFGWTVLAFVSVLTAIFLSPILVECVAQARGLNID